MCDHCDYEEVLSTIDDMLMYDEYDFARDTLEGIRDWIQDKHHVTERQKQSIENIKNSKEI